MDTEPIRLSSLRHNTYVAEEVAAAVAFLARNHDLLGRIAPAQREIIQILASPMRYALAVTARGLNPWT